MFQARIVFATACLATLSLLGPSAARAADLDPRDSSPYPEEAFQQSGQNFEEFQKFTVFLDANDKPERILFQNQEKYDRHGDFLATLPQFAGLTLAQIDDVTYRSLPRRRAILGVLTTRAFDDSIFYSNFNLVMADMPRIDDIITIHAMLELAAKDHLELPGDALDFEPLAHQRDGMVAIGPALRAHGIRITPANVEQMQVPYTNAWKVGKLEWVGSEEELAAKVAVGKINAQTILVTDQNLREFPPVAGLISALPLTPASHAVFLAQMYAAPVAYIKNAVALFKSRAGEQIYFNASIPPGSSPDERQVDYSFHFSDTDIARMLEFKAQPSLQITVDLSEQSVRSVRELDRSHIPAYGGKASQMGLIMTTIPEHAVKEAAGIPISFFRKFLETAQTQTGEALAPYVARQLGDIAAGEETSTKAGAILKNVRQTIQDTAIPAEIIAPIRQSLEKIFPGSSVRLKLRSSSNVEDGAEFNGAGLYDSEGVWLNGGPANDLEKGLKKVWASLYTHRGFIARRRFQVDESLTGMGILATPPFKGELNNGVAMLVIGANGKSRFECTGYLGEEKQVTHGSGELRPEVVSISEGRWLHVDQAYEGYSKKRTLMRQKDYFTLATAMQKLATRYATDGKEIQIESEWKQMPGSSEPQTFLKQVRPVPVERKLLSRDGSSFLFVVPEELQIREHDQTNYAFDALWTPRHVRLKMKTFSEQELRQGKVQVDRVEFEIEGNAYAVDHPEVQVRDGFQNRTKEIEIALPHPVLKTLRLTVAVPLSMGMPVFTAASKGLRYRYDADASDFKRWKAVKPSVSMDVTIDMAKPLEPGDSWYDDSVPGTGRLQLEVTSRLPLAITLEQLKTRGNGEYRELKLGHALIRGLLQRELEIPSYAIGYGANHHQGLEEFVFDLFSDKSLTPMEKKTLGKMGARYLFLATENSQDYDVIFLVAEDGKTKKAGTWSFPNKQ